MRALSDGSFRALRLWITAPVLVVVALALIFILSAGLRHPERSASNQGPWTVPPGQEIRTLLAERMERNGVGVVVGIIDPRGRRVITYGRRSAIDDRPLDGDTVFQLGSVTKGITTLLLADMVTRGEVRLDDPAAAYLPDGVGMPNRGCPITLRDLATHMSGLPAMPTNFDLRGDPDPYEAYSVEQLHEFLSSYTPERKPGVRAVYSNLGVALLGRLLANRARTDYEPLLKERVLEPLGMDSTSIALDEDQRRRLAPGHDTYLEPVRTWEMTTLPASGSLRTTANDMLNLIAAYLGYEETPLQSAMNLQLRKHGPQNDRMRALGWGIGSDGTVRHAGGKQGYRSGVAFNRGTGIGAVVLANARTDDRPIDLALHLVTGKPLEPAPAAPKRKRRLELPHAVLDRYAGRYLLPDGRELEVARNGSRLVVRYPSHAVLEFVATGPRDFFYNAGNDDITFELGPAARVTGLILYGDGKAAGGGQRAWRRGSAPTERQPSANRAPTERQPSANRAMTGRQPSDGLNQHRRQAPPSPPRHRAITERPPEPAPAPGASLTARHSARAVRELPAARERTVALRAG